MPRPVAFRHNAVDFKLFHEYGTYFGIDHNDKGKPYVVFVNAHEDGTPVYSEGEPDVGEVCNAGDTPEEAQKWVDEINAEFGTTFTPADFFGR